MKALGALALLLLLLSRPAAVWALRLAGPRAAPAVGLAGLQVRGPRSSLLRLSSQAGDGSATTTATATATASSLKDRLSAAGRGGLLSYGILNFTYYVALTAFAWTFTTAGRAEAAAAAVASSRLKAATVRLGKVMAIVWAGSQITKPARITGAVLLAPVADRFLSEFKKRLSLPSLEAAFGILCAMLLGSTALFYVVLLFSAALIK